MKKIAIALGFVLAVMACNKAEVNPEEGFGVLNVDMTIDTKTKAALSADDLLNTASVKIYKANFKGLVREYTYSDMPSPFYLAADAYRVDVEAGEMVKADPALASWDQKSYKGSKEFTIRANQVTDVEVEAFVSNAVTCIGFDQTIVENFADGYTFTIGLDADSQLVYDASKSGSEGYFIVDGIKEPALKWTFNGTLLKDGSTFTKSGTIDNVAAGKIYKMNLRYTIKDGDLDFTLMVDYTTDNIDDTIVFVPVKTGLLPSSPFEVWAGHADVHATVDANENAGAKVQFAYRSNGAEWVYADGEFAADGSFNATLRNLTPSTSYEYALVINDEFIGESKSFTTEAAPALPNASFEYVSLVSGQKYYKFYDPDCGVEGANTKFWASGNSDEESKGSIKPGSMAQITVPDTEDYYTGDGGKQSVRAQSLEVLSTKLAAGNLFTGQFVETVGTNGGKVNFGRPWTSRPTAIKFWAKYTTGKIDYTSSSISLTKNDYDRAQIKVAFGTWEPKKYGGTAESPVLVNTTQPNTFVDFYNDAKGGTVANGDVVIYRDGYDINKAGVTAEATDQWREYIIPINYQKGNVYPTHIIISCSASQYGDYFVGSTSSRLWLDAFELIYE